jgi:hypothetical protein
MPQLSLTPSRKHCVGLAVRMGTLLAGTVVCAATYSPVGAYASPKPSNDSMILPPSFVTLGSFATNARLHFECESDANYSTLDCRVTSLSLKKQEQVDLGELDRQSDTDFATLKNTFSKEPQAAIAERLQRSTPEQGEALRNYAAVANEVHNADTRPKLKSALAKLVEIQRNTCEISIWSSRTKFDRVGTSRRWMSNPGPQGLCNVVTVSTLGPEDNHPGLWRFTTITVSADTSSPACAFYKPLINKPEVYSWDAPDTIAAACKYLKLGD